MSDDGESLVIIDFVMVGIVERALHSVSEASGALDSGTLAGSLHSSIR
jgi:hypothetical protein